MKDQAQHANDSQFLKTDGGKTKSNAIQIPSIALPKGGGALKGIDEKFSVNPANGTASLAVPLPFTTGRNGFQPALSLSYNSGVGNSIFGIGWNVDYPAIQRKTDKKLPQYFDQQESDTFMFSGVEDLVPFLKEAESEWVTDEQTIDDFTIKRYRPRIEGAFSRIERIWPAGEPIFYWKVTTRDNTVAFFGKSPNHRVADPNDSSRVFKWLPELSFDNKGNCIVFEYKKERLDIDINTLSEANRINGLAKFANCYLKRIKYGNIQPFYPDYSQAENIYNTPSPAETVFLFETVFDYGEHINNDIKGTDNWDIRIDPFSDYRAGFEIRTYRLCQRVMMFHHFNNKEFGLGNDDTRVPYLVRSLDFSYASSSHDSPQHSELTYLKSITQTGYKKKIDGYDKKSLPPMEFSYQPLTWNKEIKTISPENIVHAPVGLTNNYQWVDLNSEGIPGMLTEQAGAWYYKCNLGDGAFTIASVVASKPSFNGLSSGILQLQDLDADGTKQIVVNTTELKGYFELTDDDDRNPLKSFDQFPNINFQDANTRMFDLNGDGMADIVMTEDNVFGWYPSKGKGGYDSKEVNLKPFDEEQGPAIVFADSTQSIFLADMCGDGLTDIVRIRNGEICYWPNLGYGKFGAKVNMGNSPLFDLPDQFNAAYLHLADVSGTGATDILYLGQNKFKAWLNLSGNAWSNTCEIDPFFATEQPNQLTVADLLGNGTSCIVWSSPLPANVNAPMRYIDLMNGRKPHVMVSHKNNFGKETKLEYKNSTQYYLEDKKKETPWITKLPFPVQCVSKVTITDKWRQTNFSTQYSYHHGYFDHAEREFRGFGRVDQTDTETFGEFAAGNINSPFITNNKLLYQPPVLTKTWFHTGAFINRNKILSQFEHEYFAPASATFNENKLPEPDFDHAELTTIELREALRSCKGMPLRQEVYELDVDELENENLKPVKLFSTTFHNCHIQLVQPRRQNFYAVFLTNESEAITYNYELDLTTPGILPDPRIAHTFNLQTDEFRNVLKAIAVVYPRIGRHVDNTLPSGAEELIAKVQQESHLSYTVNTFTNDVVNEIDYRLRLPCEVQLFELTGLLPSTGFYFSLEELRNLTSAQIDEIPYHVLPDNTSLQKRMVERVRTVYFKPDLKSPETFGVINTLALPYETYKLALTKDLLNAILGEKLPVLQEAGESYDEMLNRVLNKGGYHFENDEWWIRSGIAGFEDDAVEHFYLPQKYTDPFDNITTLQFDPYDMHIQKSTDPIGNEVELVRFDYRVLAPLELKDINGNLSEVVFDILGMPAAMAVKGKGSEGDSLTGVFTEIDRDSLIHFFTNETYDETRAQLFLGNGTARSVYYLGEEVAADGTITYGNHPACAVAITREKHVAQLSANEVSPIQIAFQYSDGSGAVIAAKVQAEPDKNGNPQWITNGKTILNNKGKPVKQYEPYFTPKHTFEEPVEIGVTPIMYYDAADRLIRTEAPDGSYSRVEFTPWFSKVFDQNDTVLEPGNAWYNKFSTSEDASEKNAALKAAVHADTPAQIFLDLPGREVISIAHNKGKRGNVIEGETIFEEKILTYTRLDAEGKPLWIQDPRGNRVMQYIFPFKPDGISESAWSERYAPCYDIAGNLLFQHSMDAGDRWMITDAAGKPFCSWDMNERQLEDNSFLAEHRMYYAEYDGLHRPTALWLTINENAPALINKIIYGESVNDAQALNLCGQSYLHHDGSGIISNTHFDFKGNLLEAQKQIVAAIKEPVIDWQDSSETSGVEPETFSQQTEYDALNRMTRLYNWHKSNTNVAIYEPQYCKRGILEAENIIVKASITEGGYVGGQTRTAIIKITYDAKGQLQHIYYGNGTVTRYSYDPQTFRLKQLRTTRKEFDADLPVSQGLKDARVLQNLYYAHDAVGNITEIYDDAFEPAFFNNQRIEARSSYKYDALYQLTEASGRENSALNNAPEQQESKAEETSLPVGSQVLRNYLQEYFYDAAGNVLKMKHRSGNDNLTDRWTRNYSYDDKSNRLLKTWTGNDEINAINYKYDTHGSMYNLYNTGEEQYIKWDYNDMIHSLNCLGGGYAYYQYDNDKQRNRKLIERLDGTNEERWYLGGMEWWRRKNANGDIKEEIETYHLFAGSLRVLIVEDVLSTDNSLLSTGTLCRYQYSNHLGSVGLEADENGIIISYEEYHPYGTTAYSLKNTDIKTANKLYRYTGMERDEETGLNYHHARYYVNWLGRWVSGDPIGIKVGINLYVYSENTPILKNDKNGKDANEKKKYTPEEYTNEYWKGVGESFLGFAFTTGAMIGNNPLIMKNLSDAESEVYNRDGLTGVINMYNPLYTIPVEAYEYKRAVDNVEPRAAGRHAFGLTMGVASLVLMFVGGRSGPGASFKVPTPAFQLVPVAAAEVPAAAIAVSWAGKPISIPVGVFGGRLGYSLMMASVQGTNNNGNVAQNGKVPTTGNPTPSKKTSAKPPLLDVVEVKSAGNVGKGFVQMEQPQYTGATAIGPSAKGGGLAGVATYSRKTGAIWLTVKKITGPGTFGARVWRGKIGTISQPELETLWIASGKNPQTFGYLVETRVRGIVSEATGQPFYNPGKVGAAHGPDWMPTQLPLPFAR